MVTAGFAPHAARSAGAGAGGLVQHGEVRGGGMGWGALRGGAPRLSHHRSVGVPEEELGEVGLLEHLTALVHCTAKGGGDGGGEVGREWRRSGGRERGKVEGIEESGRMVEMLEQRKGEEVNALIYGIVMAQGYLK